LKKRLHSLIEGDIKPDDYFESSVLTAHGEEKTIAWYNTLLKDEEGHVINVISSGEDITERKKVEKLKDEFLSTVSHELRTPLTTIREAVSQVLDGILGETTEQQRYFLSMCLEDVDRLTRIINSLLDISKIEAKKFDIKRTIVDIAALAKGVSASFSSYANEKGLQLRNNFSRESIEVYADSDKIIQVITNLLGNAFKFTESGYIELSLVDKDKWVECTVSDTGIGIAQEDLSNVFEKFRQFGRVDGPGEKGTGLGLSIVKGIIQLHKGKIWAESKLNEGSRFSFALPKYTPKELWRECIEDYLIEAREKRKPLSMMVFGITKSDIGQEKIDSDKLDCVGDKLRDLIKDNLRKGIDTVIKGEQQILLILPGMNKNIVLPVSERIKKAFRNYLFQENLQEDINMICRVACFPEDGKDYPELLAIIDK
jgi:signal transduction histidine kinase